MQSSFKRKKIHLKTSQMDFEVENEWRKELPCRNLVNLTRKLVFHKQNN
jgi:hypothetical protein